MSIETVFGSNILFAAVEPVSLFESVIDRPDAVLLVITISVPSGWAANPVMVVGADVPVKSSQTDATAWLFIVPLVVIAVRVFVMPHPAFAREIGTEGPPPPDVSRVMFEPVPPIVIELSGEVMVIDPVSPLMEVTPAEGTGPPSLRNQKIALSKSPYRNHSRQTCTIWSKTSTHVLIVDSYSIVYAVPALSATRLTPNFKVVPN